MELAGDQSSLQVLFCRSSDLTQCFKARCSYSQNSIESDLVDKALGSCYQPVSQRCWHELLEHTTMHRQLCDCSAAHCLQVPRHEFKVVEDGSRELVEIKVHLPGVLG